MPRMRCLYEVLGVERDVDDAGLRKAYRTMALKWHPGGYQCQLDPSVLLSIAAATAAAC